MLDEIKGLMAELPLEGSRRLFELWMHIPERRSGLAGQQSPLDNLCYLLIRLSEHWDSYRLFDLQKDVHWTNNATGQTIGRMKMRSRTVRGYKSWQGMHAGLLLSGTCLTFESLRRTWIDCALSYFAFSPTADVTNTPEFHR